MKLTPDEQAVFRSAHHCIQIVASQFTDSITFIKDNGQPLPGSYFDLISQFNGNMDKLRDLFCPLREKEAKQWLMKYCYENRIQPRDFQHSGKIAIQRRLKPAVETTYVSHSQDN